MNDEVPFSPSLWSSWVLLSAQGSTALKCINVTLQDYQNSSGIALSWRSQYEVTAAALSLMPCNHVIPHPVRKWKKCSQNQKLQRFFFFKHKNFILSFVDWLKPLSEGELEGMWAICIYSALLLLNLAFFQLEFPL